MEVMKWLAAQMEPDITKKKQEKKWFWTGN